MLLRRLATVPTGRVTAWVVLAVWLVLAAGAGSLSSRLEDVQQNDAQTWLPADAESTRAFDVYEREFGGGQSQAAVVVYVRSGGVTPADRGAAEADRARFAERAEGEVGPLVPSQDGEALLVSVPLPAYEDGGELASAVEELRSAARDDAPSGLEVRVTGPAGTSADLIDAFSGIDSTLLIATVLVVAVLLLLTYRSPVLWLVPLLAVGIASQVGNAVVYLLAEHAGLLVNGQSLSILPVLVFGVGTDYALLIIARYREELRRHADRREAMAKALQRALPAITASSATVVLGLLCLLFAVMNSTRGLGPVAAVGVVVAFLAMTTLLPALLSILGRWLFWPFVPRHDPAHAAGDLVEDHGRWGRIAGAVARRPRPVWIGSALALCALALGTTLLSTGLSREELFLREVDSVAGQKLLAEHYPAGSSSPADVFVRASAVEEATQVIRGTEGIAAVQPAQRNGDWAYVPAVLADPPESDAAEGTVVRLRAALDSVPEAEALVGGQTAITYDTSQAMARDERVVIPLVLGVVFVVLLVLLRALVAPLLLLASVVLSFFAALGTAALIFAALDRATIDQSLVLFGFLFLVALGVDYTIFLMTRAREEVARLGHRAGVTRAVAVTGGVITSAGVVLAATFAVLAVLPTVTSLQQGILVAVGVLLDTFVVRTLLVPALSLDVGPRVWWPSRLARPDSTDRAPGVERPGPDERPAPDPVTSSTGRRDDRS
jgi:RND superfamily putative drug exporter